MKVDVKQVLVQPEGMPFFRGPGEPWTLGGICIAALGSAPVKQQTLEANFTRWDLAAKIRNVDEADLTIAEAKTIQDCLVALSNPFLVTAAARMLEKCFNQDDKRDKRGRAARDTNNQGTI